ncbi:Glucanosyltransferase-domain-containing protein [Endogone sp. FLAS-F59071]|nr:Glucanosyltransferase-domain-containing protein [Endogone sp. FLAS-F59071]|eukprot:RUS13419.1 Glucanosyltransferase-domain-containing protein [Endogone sp. FLAS-F59071]
MTALSLLLIVSLLLTIILYVPVHSIDPMVIKGYKFFNSVTMNQFFIKGVAYQPLGQNAAFQDPLAQPQACQRDVPLMKNLSLNAIRVYAVDATQNHDACMQSLASAGIYLILDLDNPANSIDRSDPMYYLNMYNSMTATVDAFASYNNTLAFFAGNEVVNSNTTTDASPFAKAMLRDAKAYIKNTKQRYIPVGYASNDDASIRKQLLDYFNCGDPSVQADFYGVNLYEWCGNTVNFNTSGYAARTNDFSNYSVPVILSEYGCNLVTPRTFPEVAAIYGPEMTNVWSGGIVYEWTEEANNYGLVQITTNGTATILPDYTNFQKAIAAVNPQGVQMNQFSSSRQSQQCPPMGPAWAASTTLPPTPSAGTCQCMVSSLSCVSSTQVQTNTTTLGQQLDVVCGLVPCTDVSVNGTTGVYGKYSFCNPQDKLSYEYNLYYNYYNQAPTACNFAGNAKLVSPQRQSDQSCSNSTSTPTSSGAMKALGSSPVGWISILAVLLLFLGTAVLTD